MVVCLERGADCLHIVQLMPLHPQTPPCLASFKSRLVLPFWYRLIQAVLEKRPLNHKRPLRGCDEFVVHVHTAMQGANFAKNIVSQSIWGTTPCTAKGRVGVGMEGDWIGLGVRLCLKWGLEIVGHEKAEFSQICKWNCK